MNRPELNDRPSRVRIPVRPYLYAGLLCLLLGGAATADYLKDY